jgi:outer membrane protein assembly factor BamB
MNAAVVSRDRVYVTAGETLFAFDKRGKRAWTFREPGSLLLSAPTADRDGRVFVAGASAMAFDSRGTLLWTKPLARHRREDGEQERAQAQPLALSPDGLLYSAQDDGRLVVLEAAAGELRWERDLGLGSTRADVEIVGVDSTIVAVNAGLLVGHRLVDRLRGALLPPVPFTAAGASQPLILPFARGLGMGLYYIEGYLSGAATAPRVRHHAFYSLQGGWRFSLPVAANDSFQGPRLVDLDGHLVVLEGSNPRERSDDRLHRLGCDGRPLDTVEVATHAPSFLGDPMTLGSDGVSYAITRPSGGARSSQLIAFDETLHELWRIDFPGQTLPLSSYGPTLDEDGTLYLVLENVAAGTPRPGTSQLIAVQTTSPGLARSAWPTYRHDSQGTNWVQ